MQTPPDSWDDAYDKLPVTYSHLKGLAWTTVREQYTLANFLPRQGMMLEVGTASGVTAAIVATYRPDARIVSLDIFEPAAHADEDRVSHDDADPLKRFGNWADNARKNQSLFVGTLMQFRRLQPAVRFDLIFIDGGHNFESVYNDLLLAPSLLKEGGTIICHDYNDPTWFQVTDAVNQFVQEQPFDLVSTVGSLAIMKARSI